MKTLFFDPEKACAEIPPMLEKPDPVAFNTILEILKESLDDRFTCLCKYPIPGLNICIPITLVGPCGIYVMSATGISGTFRAKEDEFLEKKGKKFNPVKFNILKRTHQYYRALKKYLESQAIKTHEIEPVIFFTSHDVHIDTARPTARIVMEPMMKKFIQLIGDIPQNTDDITINRIITSLANPSNSSLQDKTAGQESNLTVEGENNEKVFTTGQWLILAALGLFLILLIMVFYVVVILGNPPLF
ncbi:MAG: NERD domain-containing protein [Anaerolineales bacterium]|nr:NERD domain-containing protein [Anaerolineales bacterium]